MWGQQQGQFNAGFNQQGGFNQGQGFNQGGFGSFVGIAANLGSVLSQPYSHGFNLGGQQKHMIRTKATGRALDASQTSDWGNFAGDLIIYDYVNGANQQWYIVRDGMDYIIVNCKSGKVIDALGGQGGGFNTGINTNVGLGGIGGFGANIGTGIGGVVGGHNHGSRSDRVTENMYNGSAGQRWRIQEKSAGLGEFVIYSSANGKVLDVCGAKGENNSPVITYNFHGKDNQIWYITPVQQGGFNNNQGFNQQGGFHQGGFNQGGFNQGGFNQGGFNQGGFNAGFDGGFNAGGQGFNAGGQGGFGGKPW